MLPRNKIHDSWLPKGGSFSVTDKLVPKSDTFLPAKVTVHIWALQQSRAHYTANLYNSWSRHKLWFLHAKPKDRVKTILGHNSLSFGLSHYYKLIGYHPQEKNMWRFLSAWKSQSGEPSFVNIFQLSRKVWGFTVSDMMNFNNAARES